jgi:hypothetical protein
VLVAVIANAVIRREDRAEMLVKGMGCIGGEPAKACQAGSFLVELAVVPSHVIGCKDPEQMIDESLVGQLREAAETRDSSH